MNKKRLFLAIPLSQYFLNLFEQYQKSFPLKNIRWIVSSNLHVTVYFLGGVEESQVGSLSAKLKSELSLLPPFTLEFEKMMFAPPHRPPRMVWAVFKANQEYRNMVFKIAEAVKEFCESGSEHKEPVAHVTLARFKDPHSVRGAELKQPTVEKKILDVSHCHLMESKLTPQGSLYTLVQSFPL